MSKPLSSASRPLSGRQLGADCLLMSPISVSTFLKPEVFHFDLVVFDEASQLPTAEAVPAVLRASQVVVAGDRNQFMLHDVDRVLVTGSMALSGTRTFLQTSGKASHVVTAANNLELASSGH
jgi:hypothetical protein